MKGLLPLVILASLALAGCGGSDQKNNKEAASGASQSSGNPVTAPVDYLGAVSKAQRHAVKSADLSALNQAIRLFQAEEERYPSSLNEVVSKGYLRELPRLPTGMKYQYNPQNGQVTAVAQ